VHSSTTAPGPKLTAPHGNRIAQGLPARRERGRQLRQAFVASPGYVLVSAGVPLREEGYAGWVAPPCPLAARASSLLAATSLLLPSALLLSHRNSRLFPQPKPWQSKTPHPSCSTHPTLRIILDRLSQTSLKLSCASWRPSAASPCWWVHADVTSSLPCLVSFELLQDAQHLSVTARVTRQKRLQIAIDRNMRHDGMMACWATATGRRHHCCL
jgi:hypothetical protein